MKSLWGIALALVCCSTVMVPSARAQGTVAFQNSSLTRVYYYGPSGFTFIPPGSLFSAELMYAPDGTPAELFDAVAVRVGAPTAFGGSVMIPGIFQGGNRTAPITPAGGFGLFQVRVWETAYGTDYASMLASGNGQAGVSTILRVDTGNPTLIPPQTPTLLVTAGLTSFCVTPAFVTPACVPEPSVVVLGFAAAIAALLAFQKRSHS